MARTRTLDQKLFAKIAKKRKLDDLRKVNVLVSKKASKLGISSEAALIILAKELGIGTASYQKKLDSAKQTEVRDSLPSVFAVGSNSTQKTVTAKQTRINNRTVLKAAIEYLIQDKELKSRCGDILLASANFDRPINQATLVLEDRIRNKAQPPERLVGENLVGYAFKKNIPETVLKISDDPEDQKGFTDILRGVVPAFRNRTHHYIIDTFTREDALRVCGFIDVLLRIVDNSEKIR